MVIVFITHYFVAQDWMYLPHVCAHSIVYGFDVHTFCLITDSAFIVLSKMIQGSH